MKIKKFLVTLMMITTLVHTQVYAQTSLPGGDAGDLGTMLTTMLTSMGMSYINSSIIRCRGVTPDSVLAGVGAITHLGGEIYTNLAQSSVNSMTVDPNDSTQAAFDKQIKSMEELKKNLETKYTVQMAAATAYGLASGTGLLGWYSINQGREQCSTAAKSSEASCLADKSKCDEAVQTCKTGIIACKAAEKCTAASHCQPLVQKCEAQKTMCRSAKVLCEDVLAGAKGKSMFEEKSFKANIDKEATSTVKKKSLVSGDSSFIDKHKDPFLCINSCQNISEQFTSCKQQLSSVQKNELVQVKAREDNQEYSTKNSLMIDKILLQTDYSMAAGCGNPNISKVGKDRENLLEEAGGMDGIAGMFAGVQGFVHDTGSSLISIGSGDDPKGREQEYRNYQLSVYSDEEMATLKERLSIEQGQEGLFEKIAKGGPGNSIDDHWTSFTDAQQKQLMKMGQEGFKLSKKQKTSYSKKDIDNAKKFAFSCAESARNTCTAFGDMLSKSLNRCTDVLAPKEAGGKTSVMGDIFGQVDNFKQNPVLFAKYKKVKNTVEDFFVNHNMFNFVEEKQIKLSQNYNSFLVSYNEEKTYNADSYFRFYEKMLFINGIKKSITLNDYVKFKDSLNNVREDSSMGVKSVLKVAMDNGFNLLFPKAYAVDTMGMVALALNVGPQLWGIWQAMTATNMSKVDKYMATYNKRAMVFGVASAMLGVNAYLTSTKINEVKSNLDKIKKAQEQMSGGGGSGGGDGGGGGGSSSYGGTNDSLANQVPQDYDKIEIPKSDQVLDNNLPCVTPDCKPIEQALNKGMDPNMMDGLSSGDSNRMAKALQGATDIGNALQGKNKIKSSTLGKIKSLGKNKNAIDLLNKKLQRRINDQLVGMGKSKVDFDGLQKKLMDNLRKTASVGLAGANMGAIEVPSMLSNTNITKKKSHRASDLYLTGRISNKRGRKMNPSSDDDIITKIDDDPAENIQLSVQPSGSDIIADKSRSLWIIISGRYIKTGVDHLLEESDNK